MSDESTLTSSAGLEESSGADIPPPPDFQLGGQALVEGVMMRSPRYVAAAVRHPDGHIEVKVEPFVSFFKRNPVFNIPFLRGTFALIEMMALGMRYLNWSSNIALEEDTPKNAEQSTQSTENTLQNEAEPERTTRGV